MDKVRIGFVGVGFMGQMAHLRNYVALPDCEVVAIAEPKPEQAKTVAAKYGVPEIFEDHETMLANTKLDGVVASQPYSRHAFLVPDLLQAKVPVFTEKPISVGIETGERLAACAAENETLFMVGYHKRSDPAMEYAVATIKRWQASGDAGAMRLVRATMPPGDWIAGGSQGVFLTQEAVPGLEFEGPPADMDSSTFDQYNAFVNYYIHQVNAIRFLLGEDYQPTFADKSGVLMIGESTSGVSVSLEMAPYNTRVDWQETYLVAFEHGYVYVELPAPLASQEPGRVKVMLDRESDELGTEIVPALPKRHAMLGQAMNFVAAIKGDKPAPCEAGEAVADLKVAREYIRLYTGK